jgi:hypothetical protein
MKKMSQARRPRLSAIYSEVANLGDKTRTESLANAARAVAQVRD